MIDAAERVVVADVIGRITPTDAVDLPSLEAATAYAVEHIDSVFERATSASSCKFGHHASAFATDSRARFILRELVRIRNCWLKDHGVFRHG